MARYFRRRKFCRFTAEGVQEIDYKDIATLKTISPHKVVKLYQAVSPVLVQNTSVSWLDAIKRARYLSYYLIPIVISNRYYIVH